MDETHAKPLRMHLSEPKAQASVPMVSASEQDVAPMPRRFTLARLDTRKHDGLITDDAVCTVGGCGVEAPCVYVRLRASYKKGTGLM
jgi:hypothetical protein